jgi:hypothetical protein
MISWWLMAIRLLRRQVRQIEAYMLPHVPHPDNAPLAQFKVPLQQVWT